MNLEALFQKKKPLPHVDVQWHVLRTADGRYASKTWEIFNTAMRRPRLSLAADLNQNEITKIVNLYTSYEDAVYESCRYFDVLGEVLFPAAVEFFGQGHHAVMLEKE